MKLQNTLQIIIAVLILSNFSINAQDEDFYVSDGYVNSENFENSIRLYQRVLDEEPNNPTVNFKLGFCYLNTPGQKNKAIKYIEKSVKYFEKKKRRMRKRKKEYLESCFYLAKAYQANGKFDNAVRRYKELKKKVSSKKLIDAIDQEIINTAKTRSLLLDSTLSTITNLGGTINSKYSDHSAFVSADESILLFTSRRENSYNDFVYFDDEYDENIYICYRNPDSTWTAPKSIGDNINTPDHEAVIGLSADGQQLFIYKSDDRGSIYVSNLIGDEWSKPYKLGPNINTRQRETSASISADGSTLYFTSDRSGGFGGLDIYCSKKQPDGTWGKAQNLGQGINTDGDERAPYIHPDGKTLFFSSQGHISIGGFDIFSAKRNEFGTWTKPVNMGYPINTILDDVYYVGTADGKRSYYTSSRKGGYGKTDIYVIDLKDASFEPSITLMKGKISIEKGKLPEISIIVKDKKTNKVEGIYTPNFKTGKFLFVLNKGREFVVELYTDEGIFYKETLSVDKSSEYQQLYKELIIPVDSAGRPQAIKIIDLKAQAEKKKNKKKETKNKREELKEEECETSISIQNILFPSNSKKIPRGNSSLAKIAAYLVANPNAIIEVGSYADAQGGAAYNYRLTEKRANSVKNYLTRLDVKPKQIKTVAYGEENPIALNKNKDGSWNRLGQRYNRRIEFRVIKQGKTTVFVKPIMNIPKYLLNDKYDKDYVKDKNKHLEIKY